MTMSVNLQELGDYARASREDRRLSQEALAAAITPASNRSVVAHLEQGRRVPERDVLIRLCQFLGVPEKYWKPFVGTESHGDDAFAVRLRFEEAISELTGGHVSLRSHDQHTVQIAQSAIARLFAADPTEPQARDALNSVLVYYGIPAISPEFFSKFIKADAFRSPETLLESVRRYQACAIRLFASFPEAFDKLNTAKDLQAALAQLQPRLDDAYRSRLAWDVIELIPPERLPDLGYIAAAKIREERAEREKAASFLREAADAVAAGGKGAITSFGEKRLRRMESLLRKFGSRLPHGFLSPLFAADADTLRREAEHVAPRNLRDVDRIEQTQAVAQRNLACYLAADHMDVYVATSMRSNADFVSVHNYVNALFHHDDVRPLRLRYFDPTQSWIEDRVAKGLVEALMLRRCSICVYMAQKSDTFGKDSEASVALGQGKPVIVYVPRLHIPAAKIDSEKLGLTPESDIRAQVAAEEQGSDVDELEEMDSIALLGRIITLRLRSTSSKELASALISHWADFDLHGEADRLPQEKRSAYRTWLDGAIGSREPAEVPADLREDLIGILVANAVNFEKRAKLFREQHPLALQVILSTGVLNGMLVVRSVSSCASLLRSLLRNELSFELKIDDHNYRLIEQSTGSTVRVIARHSLISHAFTEYYGRRSRAS